MKRQKSPTYLDWLRGLPCIICRDNTTTEAAHVRYGDLEHGKRPTGLGERPDDRWALPLCHRHHTDDQHRMSERAFWEKHGIDPIMLCMKLFRYWQRI
jgi:hypothetical protein